MADAGLEQFVAAVRRNTQAWLERAVIGLHLCPFAKAVHVRGQVHYAVSRASTEEGLLQHLVKELLDLIALDPEVRDTTLLMAPYCFSEFLDFNEFLGRADQALVDLGLDGVVQIASFHPRFQFASTRPDDITNNTNRAPYPTLHLLREASLDRAVEAFPQAESIFERNLATMERLGSAGWEALGLQRTASSEEGRGQTGARRGKTKP